jgi:hypothetical protein
MPEADHEIDIIVVVSGVPRALHVNTMEPLRSVVREVLGMSGDVPQTSSNSVPRAERCLI